MGRGFQVLVNIDLTRKDRATFEAFEAAVAGLDEVIEVRKRTASTPSWFVAVSDDHPGGRVSALKRDGDSPDQPGLSAPLSEVLGRSTMVVLMAHLFPVQG